MDHILGIMLSIGGTACCGADVFYSPDPWNWADSPLMSLDEDWDVMKLANIRESCMERLQSVRSLDCFPHLPTWEAAPRAFFACIWKGREPMGSSKGVPTFFSL